MSRDREGRRFVTGLMIVSLVFLLAVAFALAACGSVSTNSTSTSSSPAAGGGSGSGDTIKVGVVTPLSGFEATLGQGTLAMAKLWAQQTNASGGLLGKKVQLLVQDSATDPKTANQGAKVVLGQGASVVLGSILDGERTAVEPVVTGAGKIYLFSTYYEGGDYTPLSFYTAETPQQTTEKFVPWMVQQYGNKWYFLGSDYAYPHGVNTLAKKYLQQAGGSSVGEQYVALGTTDFSSIITKLASAKPQVVYSNIVGTDAVAFMKQFYDYGLSSKMKLFEPLDQTFVKAIGVKQVEGVPVCQGYWQTIASPTNTAFVAAYNKVEPSIPPVDITVSHYVALELWAAGVKKAGTTDGAAVAKAMEGLTLADTPVGAITIDPKTHHTARHMYIAVAKNGQFQVVKDLGVIQPGPDAAAPK